MRLLPVNADLPWSTRQLSKTMSISQSLVHSYKSSDGCDGPALTQHFAGLELEPVLVIGIADESVKFPRTSKSTLHNLRFDARLDTHAAELYQRFIKGPPRSRSTPARSAVFHRTCMRRPVLSGVWFKTGKACAGWMPTPSLPLAWAKSLTLLRCLYASGSSA